MSNLVGLQAGKRIFFVLTMCLAMLLPGQAQESKTAILWDSYGVPHVFGKNMTEMYYGFGWAQMRNHANLILRLYAQARGKAAEYWGPNFFASDKQTQLFKIPELAEKAYTGQDAAFKNYLDAFVKGLNAYAKAHPEAINAENKPVLPVTAQDVIAHSLRVLYLQFVAGGDINVTARMIKPGSNSYAIGRSRSATHNAMLVANPHLLWQDLYTFFEAQLKAPGFNAYGASLVGLPVLNIAFNDHLGWTHTVNTIDASDRYELTVQGDGYLLDGAVVPFEKKTTTIKIKQTDGTVKDSTLTFSYSQHGPVLVEKNNKAYAIRIAGIENPAVLYQWHRMASAHNWKEFEAALKQMQLPMFNVIYADGDGNILYLFDGNVPDRSEGDWRFWHTTINGTDSKYIWKKTLPYESLPKLFNPATGFVQNANDPPWSCTYPAVLDPKSFPAHLSPLGVDLRPQHAINMIKNDPAVSFEKLISYKLNTEMEAADRFLDDLLTAVQQHPDPNATKAADVLKSWDRCTNAGSRGAVLFAAWFDKLHDSMFVKPWDPAHPVETPAGLKNQQAAVDLLTAAAKEVVKTYDSLNVAWGDVYRLRMNDLDYPANGGDGKYGVYRVFYFRKDKEKYRAFGGDSYVAITEFGKPVRAQVLLSYGNASQPGSKHMGDQLQLLSQNKLRTAWLTKEEIEKHLEEKEPLVVQP